MPDGLTTTIYAAGGSFEKISRSDGSLDVKTYVGGFAIVTERTTGGSTTTSTAYTLTDHLGSIDTITDSAGNLVQKMSFDAWGKRRQASWANLASPLYFDTSITTRGFTGHEEIDQVGLVHMNGRVYDPELGRFLSADPFVQDASNAQSWNRYSYVLNNPLSMTDPTGFFFGSIFNAIGNFVGSVFKAVASVFKAALKIPLLRAVIQIAACSGTGPVGAGICIAAAGALALAAGGGIGDAIQAMAFSAASMGVWTGVGNMLHGLESAFSTANMLVTSAVHGVVNGALSVMQGGTFVDGFVSGAIGQAAGMYASAKGSPLAGIGGMDGKVIRSIFAGAAGGAASELTGGKFMTGFVSAAFAQMWNQEAGVMNCIGAGLATAGACAGATALAASCPASYGASCAASVPGAAAAYASCAGLGATVMGACGLANSGTAGAGKSVGHANSYLYAGRPTYVYELVVVAGPDVGEILKFGITSEARPRNRYPSWFYKQHGAEMVILAQYSFRSIARVDEFTRCTTYSVANGSMPKLSTSC